MQVEVNWQSGRSFEGVTPTGGKIEFDGSPEHSGPGTSPMEALLCSLAACTAMDVVSILEKKRQTVTGYRLEVTGDRPPQGEWPRPFTAITVNHVIKGENIDPEAVARAIELSDEKYCSVSATVKLGAKVTSTWQVE